MKKENKSMVNLSLITMSFAWTKRACEKYVKNNNNNLNTSNKNQQSAHRQH